MKVIIVLWRFKIIDEITNDFLPISKVINLVWSEKTVQPVFTEPTYSFLIQAPPCWEAGLQNIRSLDRSLHQEHREYASCIVFCSSTVKLNRSTAEKTSLRGYILDHTDTHFLGQLTASLITTEIKKSFLQNNEIDSEWIVTLK